MNRLAAILGALGGALTLGACEQPTDPAMFSPFLAGQDDDRICTIHAGDEDRKLTVGDSARITVEGKSCRLMATSTRPNGTCIYALDCS